jgi:hypothetical protein
MGTGRIKHEEEWTRELCQITLLRAKEWIEKEKKKWKLMFLSGHPFKYLPDKMLLKLLHFWIARAY